MSATGHADTPPRHWPVVLAAPIGAALDAGASKAAVCRSFGIPRRTLNGALARAGWTGGG